MKFSLNEPEKSAPDHDQGDDRSRLIDCLDRIKNDLELRAYSEAASVLESIWIDWFREGRVEELSRLIGTLPEELRKDTPCLLLDLLCSLFSSLSEPEREELLKGKEDKSRKKGVPPLRIETFGGFRVFRAGEAMDETEWEGNQPKLLLKAIICNRSRGGIPKDVVIEALWPEVSAETGERNFKVILYRLRRILEPALDKAHGSSYIRLKGSLIYLDEELVCVDVGEFLTLISKGEKEEKAKGDIKVAAALYEQAVEGYKGEFLPEDLYTRWIDLKRSELRARYIDLLTRLAELHEARGASKKAIHYYQEVLKAEPLLEEAYQRLMTLYANIGHKNAALQIFEQCRAVLSEELGAEPDELTVAIYRKLLAPS